MQSTQLKSMGCEMFCTIVDGSDHFCGGTDKGCDFLSSDIPWIPYSFIGSVHPKPSELWIHRIHHFLLSIHYITILAIFLIYFYLHLYVCSAHLTLLVPVCITLCVVAIGFLFMLEIQYALCITFMYLYTVSLQLFLAVNIMAKK